MGERERKVERQRIHRGCNIDVENMILKGEERENCSHINTLTERYVRKDEAEGRCKKEKE